METISTIKRNRATYGSLTVEANVYSGSNERIEDGNVRDTDGNHKANFTLHGDGSFNLNVHSGVDRREALEAVESFIAEATAPEADEPETPEEQPEVAE